LSEHKPLTEWQPAYDFDLQPHELSAYEDMCLFQQTSASSMFTQKRVCSLATRNGRISLSNNRLIVTRDGERTERDLSDIECPTALRDYFGIVLPSTNPMPQQPAAAISQSTEDTHAATA
jgi:N-hydroxyarylamine O-acetyltransferase